MQHSVSAALEADPAGLSSAAAKEAMAAEAEAVPVAAHTEAAVAAVDVAAEQTEAADLSEESIQIPPAVAKADDAVAQRQATKGRRDGADGEVEVAKEASEADTVADGGASEAGIHALVTLETPPPLLPAGTPQSTTIAFSGDDAAAEENERVPAEADSSQKAAEQETAELKTSKKKPVQLATTIALIDDDVVMLRLMTVQFRKLGGVVSPFSSGSAFIRSGGVSELWDVIVVDHLMPELNGIQTIEAIAESNKGTLMCLASGEVFPNERDQASIDKRGCPFFLKSKTCCAEIIRWYSLATASKPHRLSSSVASPRHGNHTDAPRQRRLSPIIPVAETVAPDLFRTVVSPRGGCNKRKLALLQPEQRDVLQLAISDVACPNDLSMLHEDQVKRLIDKSFASEHQCDEVVVGQNQIFPCWSAVLSGVVSVTQDSSENAKLLSAGMWFGSFSAIKSAVTVTVCEPCVLVFLNKTDLEIASRFSAVRVSQPSHEFGSLQLPSLSFVPRNIGEGNYGKVFACIKDDQSIFALKCVSHQDGEIDMILNEVAVLQTLEHPNIVRLHGVLEDRVNIYLVMELIPGGDLFDHLISRTILPEPDVKFYVVNVIDALTYLHARQIVFRDLKPENLMLTAGGQLQLVDFGFAKQLKYSGEAKDLQKAYTACGTADYLAPEVQTRRGHGLPVDLWALGILTYEMLVGGAPVLYLELEMEYGSLIDFPKNVSVTTDAMDFVRALIVSEPAKRLCCDSGSDRDIMKHKWLDQFILAEAAAPYVPSEIHIANISNTVPYHDFHKFLISRERV